MRLCLLLHVGALLSLTTQAAPSATPPARLGDRTILRPGRSSAVTYPTPPVVLPGRSAALRGLTDPSLWPAPLSETHAAAGDWTLLGKDEAAQGPDCPFLTHATATTLAACQAACAADGPCNEINWNEQITDCVLRACSSPLSPILGPATGYDAWGVLKAAFTVDAANFKYASIGFRNDVLDSAMRRYQSIAFPYGVGRASEHAAGHVLPGGRLAAGVVSGLLINVTTSDDALFEVRPLVGNARRECLCDAACAILCCCLDVCRSQL